MPNVTRPPDRPWPGERLAGEGRPTGEMPRQAARASAERLFRGDQPAAAPASRSPASRPPASRPPASHHPASHQREIPLRGSMGHLPSAATDDEMKARRDAYERTLWQAHRGLVLRLDDPDLTGTHRLMIEALARARGFA